MREAPAARRTHQGRPSDCDVGAKAVPDHNVAAQIGGQPPGLPRVAFHAQIFRRRRRAETRQGGSHEPDRRVPQARLSKQVVVEDRRGERSGKQQDRVIGTLGPGLDAEPNQDALGSPRSRSQLFPHDPKSRRRCSHSVNDGALPVSAFTPEGINQARAAER